MTAIGELIGRGLVADVHVFGERAVKLLHAGRPATAAFVEAATLSIVGSHPVIPAPRVHAVGNYFGRWGLVLDRVEGPTLGEAALADPSLVPATLEEMVRLQLLVHDVRETRLRPLKARLAGNIAATSLLTETVKVRLLGLLAGLPDGDRICHGDFHPLNLLGRPGSCIIVDWLDATCGPPAADACRSYLLLRQGAPDVAAPYLRLYAGRSRMPAEAILAWLPCVAAARLAEGIEKERPALISMAESA